MSINYIGADVHPYNTELSVENRKKIVSRYSVPTTIPAIAEILKALPGKKYLAMEEGPMAGWLYRNLQRFVDKLIICDPRRNKYIYADGDVDDTIAADKLAQLLRGGYLRAVHHTDDEDRMELKHWVGLYHDRVHAAVAQMNKIRGRGTMHGVQIPSRVLRDPTYREAWLKEQKHPSLAQQLKLLWIGYDATAQQAKMAKQQLHKLSKQQTIIQYWKDLPGVGLIRSVTVFAYLDTPWRFKRKSKLWKYAGVGIRHFSSSKDRHGNPRPARLGLERHCNRKLKDALMGATNSAINMRDPNIFKNAYERLRHEGTLANNARHTVARMMLTVMWGMWKGMTPFNPRLYQDSHVK
jgi:transposase